MPCFKHRRLTRNGRPGEVLYLLRSCLPLWDFVACISLSAVLFASVPVLVLGGNLLENTWCRLGSRPICLRTAPFDCGIMTRSGPCPVSRTNRVVCSYSGMLKSKTRPLAAPPEEEETRPEDMLDWEPVPMKKAYSPGLRSSLRVILYILMPTCSEEQETSLSFFTPDLPPPMPPKEPT